MPALSAGSGNDTGTVPPIPPGPGLRGAGGKAGGTLALLLSRDGGSWSRRLCFLSCWAPLSSPTGGPGSKACLNAALLHSLHTAALTHATYCNSTALYTHTGLLIFLYT
ncbi:hypothetical protein MATL_G00023730 [Megalops atlanticus]|uniref:Uncharacterized protein n=1 Tax=Megalops atlanticus TaxID=7932 RepID=A0A9D3QCI9_MEGAT|nr:hypothetical protein MATL_G00023730 [Megalops atlanticus]